MAQITFHGAARTVTGSRFLLETRGCRLLVDCGLFQGPREIRDRNHEPFPVDPESIDAVLLTHAHIDHTGYAPRLFRDGFRGPIFCSPPTAALCGLLLPDSAHLQQEEARFAAKRGFEGAEALYTEAEAKETLKRFATIPFGQWQELRHGVKARLHRTGHILGAAFAEVSFHGNKGEKKSVVFSGDLGRYDVPILKDPEPLPECDLLVMESTYGDRLHGEESARDALARELDVAMASRGTILIPAFAVGRVQDLLYELSLLMDSGRVPEWPVFVDSPMARSATNFYRQFHSEHDLDLTELERLGRNPFERPNFRLVRAREESQALNERRGEQIIISASGMAAGGRIVHHLRHRLADPANTILFVGYQARGTRGRQLIEGAKTVDIFGEDFAVGARVAQISAFSAHADANDLLRWTGTAESRPAAIALVHGEPSAQEALRDRLAAERGWAAIIPEHGESLEL